jgi:hypothetical protein
MSINAKVYATNMYGTSNPTSSNSEAKITLLVPPSVPAAPITINDGSSIIVSWTEPSTITPILNYTILIQCADQTWAVSPYCDGTDQTVVSNGNCTIS